MKAAPNAVRGAARARGAVAPSSILAPLLILALPCAHAADTGWHTTWDATLYAYAVATTPVGDSVLNPGNRIAVLPEHNAATEARFNLKAENGSLRLTARPILIARAHPENAQESRNDAYLSQWQARLRASDAWNVAAGREVLNWGPAQFRSPSSPLYFDNGRSNPLRELSGVDDLKLSWTPDMNTTLTLARIAGSGHFAPTTDPWHRGWLAKWDQRGEDWALGVALAQAGGHGAFIGAHAQQSLGEAWMFYAEAGSGTRFDTLASPADPALPFAPQADSPRRTDWLLGLSYTLDNGQNLNLEYLRYNHGYTDAESAAYFARAATSPAIAGEALGAAPALLNRNYLHLVWQTNLMDEDGYARLMFTRNLDDGSNELAGYGERKLTGHVTGYALAVFNAGGARREFSSLFTRSITLGVKVALP